MLGKAKAGLPDPRVETEVADQLLRAREAADVADRRDQACRDRDVDPGDGQQAPHGRIVDGGLCDLVVQHGEVLAEAVELAQVPLDRGPLVVRKDLTCEPGSPRPIEQLGVRARRDQMRRENPEGLVFTRVR
jgi:hypothetical protein